MFLSNASVKRPVAMSCLIIGLTMLGLNAYRKMGLELLPRVDIPFITVMTIYPGASPSDIEVDVAKRIEDAVASVDGLKHVTSTCMENAVQTLLEFHLNIDVNVAATDVREKIDKEVSKFPSGVENPIIMKFDINAIPIATIALSGDVPIDELYDFADNELRDRLSAIPGVANLELIGGSEREVHVLLDRDALFAAGLTSMNVFRALQEGIDTIPSGRVRESVSEYSVRFDAEYDTVKEIGELQVAGGKGPRRYVRDLGAVIMASEERRQESFINGRPCIGIRIVKKADANAVQVVNNVKKALDKVRRTLPGGMDIVWVTDIGSFIQASVDSTTSNIITGILLTAGILFFFLFNVRSTFVVSVTMPVTVIITLFLMQMLDYTLNMPTLLALGLSVGVLVTNSIVVLESIMSHFNRTGDAWSAAQNGTGEVALAVAASAGTNIVVLFPIGMMSGLMGKFFGPFAWTMLLVNVVSLFISFTLTPMLCAALLKKGAAEGSFLTRMEKRVNGFLDGVVGDYVGFLRLIARRRWTCALILVPAILVLFQSLSLGSKIGFSFMPKQDRGEIVVKLEFPTYQNLAETVRRAKEVEKRLRDIPHLTYCLTTCGKVEGIIGQSSEGVYLAQILLKFTVKTEREIGIHELVAEVRKRLEGASDCITTVSIPSPVGGQEVPIDMEIAGADLGELEAIALEAIRTASAIPGILEPDTSVRAGKPEIRALPRRAVLADIGVAPREVGYMLRANIEGLKAATLKRGDRTYDIRVKFAEEPGKNQVAEFQFPAGRGATVALANFADIKDRITPIQITRSDKRRIAKLYSNLSPELPLGIAVQKISAAIDGSGILPAGYEYVFRGDYERMSESIADFLEAGILAVILTYLILAALLESFLRPFIILTTIPMGLIGVMWALYITGTSMSMFVLLGSVMLIGIVVNNAILIMGHAQTNREHGEEIHEAMLDAVQAEFRPVIMITFAAILGMWPLAVAKGLSSEMANGIGVSSVGGIAISALLTLLVIPVIYLLFAKRAADPGK
ncbi:MAG TPA: efflux RND transporter permease subunit [Candidatus Brocadiia bacterium]|nr:efflux RND transporter permease subunit [Candidatus Brocadiia bacterium]